MWKDEDLLVETRLSDESPNLEKKPFFLGLGSSFSPTSSNPSSAVDSGRSKRRSLNDDRGRRAALESRL